MAIAFVSGQDAAADGSGGSFGVAFPSNVTGGNFIAVSSHTWYSPPTEATISDTQSNTYAQAGSSSGYRPDGLNEVIYAYDITGGANTVATVAGGDDRSIIIAEFSGVKTSADPVDGSTSTNSGNSSTLTTGAVNPTGTCLYIGAMASQNGSVSWSAGSGFTKTGSDITSDTYAPNCMVYAIGTGSKDIEASSSGSGYWGAAGAAFVEAVGVGATGKSNPLAGPFGGPLFGPIG